MSYTVIEHYRSTSAPQVRGTQVPQVRSIKSCPIWQASQVTSSRHTLNCAGSFRPTITIRPPCGVCPLNISATLNIPTFRPLKAPSSSVRAWTQKLNAVLLSLSFHYVQYSLLRRWYLLTDVLRDVTSSAQRREYSLARGYVGWFGL